jgi:hypothetical protein
MPASNPARLFVCLVIFTGFSLFADVMAQASSQSRLRLVSFLVVGCIAARLRVKLPGVTGIMSVNLPFILLAIAQMSLAEAMLVGCTSTFVQCLPRSGKKFNWVQALFNAANMALMVQVTSLIYASTTLGSVIKSRPLLLATAALGLFIVNTIPISVIIALTENKNVFRSWAAMFQLSFPYFLGSAGVAGVALTVSARVGWQVPVVVLPLMIAVFYSHKRYFSGGAFQADTRRVPQSATVAAQAVS